MRKKVHLEKIAESYLKGSETSIKDYERVLLSLAINLQRAKFDNTIDDFVVTTICNFITEYYHDKAKIYRMGTDLYNDLLKVGMNIDVSYIGHEDNKTCCIELPCCQEIAEDLYCSSVFVLFARSTSLKPTMVIVFGCCDKDDNYIDDHRTICLPCDSGKLEDIVVDIPGYKETGIPLDLIKTVLKCVLYINSGEPDLERESHKFESKKQKNFFKKIKRFSPFSVVNVGYNYKKRKFYKDSTSVTTHLRWQAYGPEKSRVKLIWVKEHERVYNKEKL